MPGIVGSITRSGNARSISDALKKLRHFEDYLVRKYSPDQRMSFGQVWRNGDDASRDWFVDDAANLAVMVNGAIFVGTNSYKRLSAEDISQRLLSDNGLEVAEFDGAFVIAVIDLVRRELSVYNDRLGTLPVYWYQDRHSFGFSPEVKALLPMCDAAAQLNSVGVTSFLSAGYCLGSTTLFDKVSMLEPGTRLTVHLDSLTVSLETYWKLIFRPDKQLNRRRSAESALYEAILAAHKMATSDVDSGFDILLSGGMDSRGNLAALERIQSMPKRAFGWGLRKDIPYSDSNVANQIATEFGLPYDFIPYDTDQLLENANTWCYLSELANDNIGWYAEGCSLLTSHYDRSADFTIVGDECWGWQGSAFNEDEAIDHVLPSRLIPPFERCAQNAIVDELTESYRSEIQKVLKKSDNERPTDRKDFLYLRGRVARFIFSLGYYKELAVQLRRPFLAGGVIDVVAGMPGRYRIWKNLYLSMLSRHFPRAMHVPDASVSSLPDWQYDVRLNPALRGFFLDHLKEEKITSGVLSGLLDYESLAVIRDAYFFQHPEPTSRKPARQLRKPNWISPVIQEHARRAKRRIVSGRNTLRERPDDTFEFLKRVALVSLIEEQLSLFSVD